MSAAVEILNSSVDFSINPAEFYKIVEARKSNNKNTQRQFGGFGVWTDFHAAAVARKGYFEGQIGDKDLTMSIKDLFEFAQTNAVTVVINGLSYETMKTTNTPQSENWRAVQIVKAEQIKDLQAYKPEQVRAGKMVDGFLITAFNADGLVASMPKILDNIKILEFDIFTGATRWEVREWDNQDGTSKLKNALCSSVYGGQDPVFWGDDI